MAQKVPPPPPLANSDPAFNRWLVELTSILNADGGINPAEISGLPALIAAVAANTAAVAVLNGEVATLTTQVATNSTNIATLQTTVAANSANIAALLARAQVLNGVGAPAAGLGNVNDWYANIGGAAGARIYVKTAVGTWTAFPF